MSKKKTDDEAGRLMALFAGHGGAHGTHGAPVLNEAKGKWEIKSTARTIHDPVSLDLWKRHLCGTRPLGVVSIREDSTCLWGSIDVDQYGDAFDPIAIVRQVSEARLPLIPCRSKSGGLHLFLFVLDPVPAALMMETLKRIADQLGLAGSEIFPKQSSIDADRGDLGNWMVMPYFGDTFDGRLKEQVGLTKDGREMSLTTFLHVAEKARASEQELPGIAVAPKPRRRRAAADADATDVLAGCPACLRSLAEAGVPEGMRNQALFNLGVHARKSHPATWQNMIAEFNHAFFRPPLSLDEVNAIVKSVGKNGYDYAIDNGTMCGKGKCTQGCFRGDLPWKIDRIVQVKNSDPVRWHVWVDGTEIRNLPTPAIMDQGRFRTAVMEMTHRYLVTITKPQWEGMNAAITIEEIEEMEDTGAEAAFAFILNDYLTNRQAGIRWEDLLGNKPFLSDDDGRYYFTMRGLMRYLQREASNTQRSIFTETYVQRQIQRLGGDTMRSEAGRAVPVTIRSRSVRVWWAPASTFKGPPSTDPPPVPGSAL